MSDTTRIWLVGVLNGGVKLQSIHKLPHLKQHMSPNVFDSVIISLNWSSADLKASWTMKPI